jgi:hypothetical protein
VSELPSGMVTLVFTDVEVRRVFGPVGLGIGLAWLADLNVLEKTEGLRRVA